MRAIFTKLERKRKRIPTDVLRALRGGVSEARVLSREEFRGLSQMRKDVVAGRRKPADVLAHIDAEWTPEQIRSDMMLRSMRRWTEGRAVWESARLDRVRKAIKAEGTRSRVFYMHRSIRGDAPPGKPWQVTRGAKVGGEFEPWGHDNYATLKDAFLDTWDSAGPLKIVMSEALDEAMPPKARTQFDSAPYANMRLRDVAALLAGAAKQDNPNAQLITKLVDRLVHALEFTIYSIQGKPEGKRIGDMIRGAFNDLTAKLPRLTPRRRREAAGVVAKLNEAIETLEIGPTEPGAR